MAKREPTHVACSHDTRYAVLDEIARRGIARTSSFMRMYYRRDDSLPLGYVQYEDENGNVIDTAEFKIRKH